jgi:3-hydroxyisobutyrate dehydrogenase-like beta-hydroxyacid dehydrogenase
MPSERVGLIGVGLLGSALAERFLAAGFRLLCFDRDPERRNAAAKAGAATAAGASEVAASCRRVVLCLPDSSAVEKVVADISPHLRGGQVLIDTTTGDPSRAAGLGRRLASASVQYVDATLSGSSDHVRRGDALIMAGGEKEACDGCGDLFQALGGRWFHVGPAGAGQTMKLVTNLVMGLNRIALAEGLAFADALGLDGEGVLRVLMSSLAYSRVMETKGRKMLQREFAPQARLSQHLKDVRLILEAAGRAGLALPLSEAHRRLLEAAESAGLGDLDNSAVIEVYSGKGRS